MSEESLIGLKIGNICVIGQIGRGGMGAVYMGFDEKLQRQVALKVIHEKDRLDAEAKWRFLREARILSQLRHPHICQIHDYIESGEQDFLVLEYIEGQTLTDAIKKGLTNDVKHRIARQIVDVLAAAHAQGIVHRDLKPGNIMLTKDNQVKVLDFGLACVLQGDVAGPNATASKAPDLPSGTDGQATVPLSDKEAAHREEEKSAYLVTKLGFVLGTLSYMSPEQARGEIATPASDLYSFGLVLQELFTGTPASAKNPDVYEQLAKASRAETLPVTGLDRDLTALINRLKSLAPSNRPSAIDTALKLEWIQEKPRRNLRKWLMAAGVVVLTSVAVIMTIQAIRIRRESNRASRESEASRQVTQFLIDVFKVSDPTESEGNTVTARELLDRGAQRADAQLKDQPLLLARMLDTFGTIYVELGLYDRGKGFLESALALRKKYSPTEDAQVAISLFHMANVHQRQADYDKAESLYHQAESIQEKVLGPEHPDLANTFNALGNLNNDKGDYARAESFYLRALKIREKALGHDHLDVATVLHNLGVLSYYKGNYAQAESYYQRALKMEVKIAGPEYPELAITNESLAVLYYEKGDYKRAQGSYLRSLAIEEKIYGPDHPVVATTLNNLGALYSSMGDYSQAEIYYGRALRIRERMIEPEHPDLATTLHNLGALYCLKGQYSQAESLLMRALKIDEKVFGPASLDSAPTLKYLGLIYDDKGNDKTAEGFYLRALRIEEKSLKPDHPDMASTYYYLGVHCHDTGAVAQSEKFLTQALDIQEKALGQDHPDVALTLHALGNLARDQKHDEEAEKLYSRASRMDENDLAKSPQNSKTCIEYARLLIDVGVMDALHGDQTGSHRAWERAVKLVESLPADDEGFLLPRLIKATAFLHLGHVDNARPLIQEIARQGYRRKPFVRLCREHHLWLDEWHSS